MIIIKLRVHDSRLESIAKKPLKSKSFFAFFKTFFRLLFLRGFRAKYHYIWWQEMEENGYQ